MYALQIHIEKPKGATKTVKLKHQYLSIGASGKCKLRLRHDGIAQKHAEITVDNDKVMLNPLSGKTTINGEEVKGEVQVKIGDLLRMGKAPLTMTLVLGNELGTPSQSISDLGSYITANDNDDLKGDKEKGGLSNTTKDASDKDSKSQKEKSVDCEESKPSNAKKLKSKAKPSDDEEDSDQKLKTSKNKDSVPIEAKRKNSDEEHDKTKGKVNNKGVGDKSGVDCDVDEKETAKKQA